MYDGPLSPEAVTFAQPRPSLYLPLSLHTSIACSSSHRLYIIPAPTLFLLFTTRLPRVSIIDAPKAAGSPRRVGREFWSQVKGPNSQSSVYGPFGRWKQVYCAVYFCTPVYIGFLTS